MEQNSHQDTDPTEKAKPCIWMKAGVIAYRMCTKNYDCKSCEFDQAIMDQNGASSDVPLIKQAIEKLRQMPAQERKCRYMLSGDFSYKICSNNYECWHCEVDQYVQDRIEANPYLIKRRQKQQQKQKQIKGFAFRDDLCYLANHIWLTGDEGTVKVGIDDFAVRLLGTLGRINFPLKEVILKDEKCWQIGAHARSLAMSLPFEATIIERNHLVESNPLIIKNDPYNRGWLLKLKLTNRPENLMKGKKVEKWLEEEFDKLHQDVENETKITITDGGEVIENIGDLLNDTEWYRIIKKFVW